MTTQQIMEKMILLTIEDNKNDTTDELKSIRGDVSISNTLHDIAHFQKVYCYADMISSLEQVDDYTRSIILASAILHDIACPILRKKYGTAEGKMQEKEGEKMVYSFFENTDASPDFVERVSYIVAHHHTLTNITSIDHQIIVEADFIVNAGESGMGKEAIKAGESAFFKTSTGKSILEQMYLK